MSHLDIPTQKYLLSLAARYYRDCVERRVEFLFGEFSNHPEHFTASFEPYLLNTALYYYNSKKVTFRRNVESEENEGRPTQALVVEDNPNFIEIPTLEQLCEDLRVKNFIEKLKAKYQKTKFDPILYNIFKSAIKKKTKWEKDLEFFSKNARERLRWLALWGAAILANIKDPERINYLVASIPKGFEDSAIVKSYFEGIQSPEMPKVDKTKNRKERRAELREKLKIEREAKKAAKAERRRQREEENRRYMAGEIQAPPQ